MDFRLDSRFYFLVSIGAVSSAESALPVPETQTLLTRRSTSPYKRRHGTGHRRTFSRNSTAADTTPPHRRRRHRRRRRRRDHHQFHDRCNRCHHHPHHTTRSMLAPRTRCRSFLCLVPPQGLVMAMVRSHALRWLRRAVRSGAAVPWLAEWIARVKEEYRALIEYQRINKEAGERPRTRHRRRRRRHHPRGSPTPPLARPLCRQRVVHH